MNSSMKLLQKLAIAYIHIRFRLLALLSEKNAAGYAFNLFCTPQQRTGGPLPPAFEAAEKLQFTFRDFSIAGYRWNKGGARRVMLIHGFESSVINFAHFVDPLIEKGYEVLAFDAPAHGRSSGRQINAVIYQDFIKAIIQAYGPVQSFLAHSFGGLAITLALAETDHDSDTRIALIAPATKSATAFRQFYQFMQINNPRMRKKIEEIVLLIGGHPVDWFSIHRALPAIPASILWVHDKKDQVTPLIDTEAIQAENYPNIRFVITDGLGHRRIYRDAAITRVIVDFL